MSGQGRIVERAFTPEERAAPGDALSVLGETTFDVYLNARAFWRNVPAAVRGYKLGGCQVLKKWLSYGLLQVHMYSTGFHGRLACHEYEGPSLDLDERERLLADLGDCNAMILRNHGLLTVGRTIPEAFIRLYRLERACQVQLDAMAAGRLHLIDPKVVEHSAKETARFLEAEAAVGELEFRALMRRLDRIDPSYRG